MNGVRLNLRLVMQQAVEDVDRFPNSTRDEMTEQRNVGIRDVVIANATITTIANAIFSQEVVLVNIPLGPIN